MRKQVIKLLFGTVRIRVESSFPERVLNLCSAHGLGFWDLWWENPTAFEVSLARKDALRLEKLAEKLDCTLTVKEKEGLRFFARRFQKRYALLGALAAAVLLSVLGSFFIWDFEIKGNDRVTDQEILRVLEEEGITYGTFGLGIHPEKLKNRVLLKIPELSWLTVNVNGLKATVIVRERLDPPQVRKEEGLCDVIAEKDALVEEVHLFGGHGQVQAGDTVKKGQLLISGVADIEERGVYFTRAEGEILGRTWYTLMAKIPKTTIEKRFTGREKRNFAVFFGKQRIKIPRNSSIFGGNCDKIMRKRKLRLPGGVATPFSVEQEWFREWEEAEREMDEKEALQKAVPALRRQLWEHMSHEGTVRQVTYETEAAEEGFIVKLHAECLEPIGRTAERS